MKPGASSTRTGNKPPAAGAPRIFWLSQAVVDILVTVFIAVSAGMDLQWGKWVLFVYTPFMVLMKGVAAFSGSVTTLPKRSRAEAPAWFYHVLYGLNVAILLFAGWWLLAAGWLAIWALSAYAASRMKLPAKSKAGRRR